VARLEKRPRRTKLRRKRSTDDVQPAEELHGHYLLPFIRTEDGTAPGEAQECQSEGTAIRRAEEMSRDPANAGAVAFSVVKAIRMSPQSSAVVFAANQPSIMSCAAHFASPASLCRNHSSVRAGRICAGWRLHHADNAWMCATSRIQQATATDRRTARGRLQSAEPELRPADHTSVASD
jgi:hypothetical protein